MSTNINDNIPTVAVICGPTATGKTRLSVELARSFDGEIVSADSMQVYRRMDIGTAKATPDERCGVPHHMIDVAEPSEQYSVARYVQEASACTNDILARGKLPLIVGGTNLYIDSLLSGRDFASAAGEDPELRAELERRYDVVSWFIGNRDALARVQEHIGDIGDLERIIARAAAGKITPKEMEGVKHYLIDVVMAE